MSDSLAHMGIVGMGVMGTSMARNFHSRGQTVAFYDRRDGVPEAFMAEFGDARFIPCADYPTLVGALAKPRRILLMVTAGPAVDAILDVLSPLLDAGDVVIDGGNSFFGDTDRRIERAAREGFLFVGMGVSGGEKGALLGPSMMPGGDPKAWEALAPVLGPAAAKAADGSPCVAYCGRGSAGHFVKMVHNGIEYGDMQLVAEAWTLLGGGLGLGPAAQAERFGRWNEGRLRSYLVEITSQIVAACDPQGPGVLVDQILDVAGQKGTGRWTAIAATEQGVAVPTISAAVDARVLSAGKAARQAVSDALALDVGPLSGVSVDDIEAALYGAKIMSYTQGFAMLRDASEERGYGTDLAQVASIWRAGCIIRAGFLDRVRAAFRADPNLPLLLLDPSFAAELRAALPAWRRVVAAATTAGYPVPAMSASLSYLDTLSRARGSAGLIQAQRDYFGAHTYRRLDAPEVAVHTDWEALPREALPRVSD